MQATNDPMMVCVADCTLVLDGDRELMRAGRSRIRRSLVPPDQRHKFKVVGGSGARAAEVRAHRGGGGPLIDEVDADLRAELDARDRTISNVAAGNARMRDRSRRPARPDWMRDPIPMLAGMRSPALTGPDADEVERPVRLDQRDVEAEAVLAAYDEAAARSRLADAHDLDPRAADEVLWENAEREARHDALRAQLEAADRASADDPLEGRGIPS